MVAMKDEKDVGRWLNSPFHDVQKYQTIIDVTRKMYCLYNKFTLSDHETCGLKGPLNTWYGNLLVSHEVSILISLHIRSM